MNNAPDADDAEPVESINGDDGELLVVDPDDYHEAQRLREIHDARREVHRVHRDIDHYTNDGEHYRQRANLAQAVSAYIYELLPALRAAGVDTSLQSKLKWDNLEAFATAGGRDFDEGEYPSYQTSMVVFSAANRAFAELKPLVQTDEDDTWEV